MLRHRVPNLRKALAIMTTGACFQLVGPCDALKYIGGLNPCGLISTCDPAVYELIRADYDGPGVQPDVDIYCTYPPFCANDPIFGGGGNP